MKTKTRTQLQQYRNPFFMCIKKYKFDAYKEAFWVKLCLDRDFHLTTSHIVGEKNWQIYAICCISNFLESEYGTIFDV